MPYQYPSTFTFSLNNTWLTTWLTVDKHTGFLPKSNFNTKEGIYNQAQLILSKLYFTTYKINQQSPSLPRKWDVSRELSLGIKRSYFSVFLKNKQTNRTGRATSKTLCASEDCPLKLKREIPNKSINVINSSKAGMYFLLSLQLRKLRHQEWNNLPNITLEVCISCFDVISDWHLCSLTQCFSNANCTFTVL